LYHPYLFTDNFFLKFFIFIEGVRKPNRGKKKRLNETLFCSDDGNLANKGIDERNL